MTSEVAVMNRLAVALAADSAVTTAQKKVFNSANKLFLLSQTVGIMVYNNASLMHVPWETLIKDFRKKLGDERYDRLEEYGDALFAYLASKMHLFDREAQKRFFLDMVDSYYAKIAERIRRELNRLESGFTPLEGDMDVKRRAIYTRVIAQETSDWTAAPRTTSLDANAGRELGGECSVEINRLTTERFKVPHPQLGNEEVEALRNFAFSLVEAEAIAPLSLSGVVIAGFGESEYFPVLQAFEVGDVYGSKVKFVRKPVVRIGENDQDTHIETFADSDTADAFLHGLPAEFERRIFEWAVMAAEVISRQAIAQCTGVSTATAADLEAALEEVREAEIFKFVERIEKHKQENYVWQTEDAIYNLPKDELAHVAAALVNINLLKKRMSLSIETVGGPIDVAVISKGDGFVWIDRKHYFSAAKNPQFLQGRYGRKNTAEDSDK